MDESTGKRISEAAREFANATLAALRIPGGVHPPTVVAACARMAGTYAFRSFDLPLEGVTPGQAVLSEPADKEGTMLMRVVANLLATLKVQIADAPPASNADPKSKPARDFLATQRLIEPLFAPIRAQHALTDRESAQAAAAATAMLIHAVVKHLDPNAGFGIAVYGIVEGTKTAPDPVRLAANP